MRFVDEYRDPTTARALVAQITALAGDDEFKFMEVCGGHTHTIYRHGIEHVLPANVELVHGPGCPVCVIPMGRVDDAIAVAMEPDVIFTSFGDMMRVPGSKGSLLDAKAGGADIRFVYSPLDALKIATENPDRDVVFFAVGFETTAPSTALTLLEARAREVANFSVFSNHVTIVPPLRAILESPDLRLDGFLGPGHVSTVVGQRPYRFVPAEYGLPLVTAGFEPLDILHAIAMLLSQIREGRCEVENQYSRVVREGGNPRALAVLAEVFELRPHFEWRGLGFIAQSGLKLRPGVRRLRRRAALPHPERAGGGPQGVPVRRGPQGRDQAVGVQGVRHGLHPRDTDRHLHGLLGGCVRGLLQLRADAPRGGGDPRAAQRFTGVTDVVPPETLVRLRLRVTGLVQGVGFRPHVHRLATELGLAGHVGNDTEGVFIEVEGARRGDRRVRCPPRGRGARAGPHRRRGDRAPHADRRGRLRHRREPGPGRRPDVRVAGHRDLRRLPRPSCFDPSDRRARYPFINCTNCGPRFTITMSLPYDRPNTTMRAFTMCDACASEYHDPADRRFHAQPVACARVRSPPVVRGGRR